MLRRVSREKPEKHLDGAFGRRQLFLEKHNQNEVGGVDTRVAKFLGYGFTATNPVKARRFRFGRFLQIEKI
jgi:hypothetical protein